MSSAFINLLPKQTCCCATIISMIWKTRLSFDMISPYSQKFILMHTHTHVYVYMYMYIYFISILHLFSHCLGFGVELGWNLWNIMQQLLCDPWMSQSNCGYRYFPSGLMQICPSKTEAENTTNVLCEQLWCAAVLLPNQL